MPWLVALVCASPFDIALHDAYGVANNTPTYQSYSSTFLNDDLNNFLDPAEGTEVLFDGKVPSDYLELNPPIKFLFGTWLVVWIHLIRAN